MINPNIIFQMTNELMTSIIGSYNFNDHFSDHQRIQNCYIILLFLRWEYYMEDLLAVMVSFSKHSTLRRSRFWFYWCNVTLYIRGIEMDNDTTRAC